jgi:hypothetical protein
MAALASNRNTDQRSADKVVLPLADNVKIYLGAIVVVDTSSGYANPGRTHTGDWAVGRANQAYPNGSTGGPGFPGDPADNTVTGHSAGAVAVEVERGCFSYDQDGSISAADIGQLAYVIDDHTVGLGDGTSTRSVAGRIVDIDTDGTSVWVNFRDQSALAT